jgi:DNA-binding NarL/FixJ family response regulator
VTALRKLARRHACDLYVLQTPLGWDEADAICRNIRSYDAHTPIVVYATQPTAADRREVLAAGAQALVTRSDDPQNLQGRVGQLVMLAELRSMDALASNAHRLHENLSKRLQQIIGTPSVNRAAAVDGATTRLKTQAARLFTKAGGTRANFERLWPGIYERALSALPKAQP